MPVSPLVRCGIVGATSCWGEEDWRTQELLVTYFSLCPVCRFRVKVSKLPPSRFVGCEGGGGRDKWGALISSFARFSGNSSDNLEKLVSNRGCGYLGLSLDKGRTGAGVVYNSHLGEEKTFSWFSKNKRGW